MAEFGTDLIVYAGHPNKNASVVLLKELLPRAFTPASLELEREQIPQQQQHQ